MGFDAELTNPKHVGRFMRRSFGPWHDTDPGESPLAGITASSTRSGRFQGDCGDSLVDRHYEGTAARPDVDGQTRRRISG